jgi:hypothetical protein
MQCLFIVKQLTNREVRAVMENVPIESLSKKANDNKLSDKVMVIDGHHRYIALQRLLDHATDGLIKRKILRKQTLKQFTVKAHFLAANTPEVSFDMMCSSSDYST